MGSFEVCHQGTASGFLAISFWIAVLASWRKCTTHWGFSILTAYLCMLYLVHQGEGKRTAGFGFGFLTVEHQACPFHGLSVLFTQNTCNLF